MKLLDRLVLKDLLPMFGFGVALFSSLWFAGGPLLEASRYLAQGFAMLVVLHLLALYIPVVLSFTFPMAMVLAVLNGFGRISGDSEAVALFAGGIPFARIAAPAAVLGLFASLCGYVINDHLATHASQQIANLKQDAFKEVQTDKPLELPPLMKDDQLQATVLVGKGIEARAGILRQVTITLYDPKAMPTTVIHAGWAHWIGGVVWELRDVDVTNLGEHAFYSHHEGLQSSEINATPEMIAFMKADPNTLSFAQLRRQVKALRAGGSGNAAEARKAELAMWRLIALPFASLVFAVIGSPLGLRPQRAGKYAGWGLAVLIIFGYYVLYMVTGSMSDGGTLPPMLAAFAPDIIGLVIGGALVFRAST